MVLIFTSTAGLLGLNNIIIVKQVDVLIVGGGSAGSVCGYHIKEAGLDCVIDDHASFIELC